LLAAPRGRWVAFFVIPERAEREPGIHNHDCSLVLAFAFPPGSNPSARQRDKHHAAT
jgi:hypothetical protein